ncbi:MAG TPA: hypothetical protein VNY31_04605 [Solirubrobacteraceae bacterium]|jgi:hypothetical protein|nr:hypothetical protein [Solirubrobacteraceae bacterium]
MTRKDWMIVLGTATVALTVVGVLLERPMEHAGAPGILAFEFTAAKVRVSQLLAEWGPAGRHAARASLIVDYAYMVSYGGFFTLAGLATRDYIRNFTSVRCHTGPGIVSPISSEQFSDPMFSFLRKAICSFTFQWV